MPAYITDAAGLKCPATTVEVLFFLVWNPILINWIPCRILISYREKV